MKKKMYNTQQSSKMWSGRFREPLDATFESWQRSFPFDWRLVPYEVEASIAHARAIEAAGIHKYDSKQFASAKRSIRLLIALVVLVYSVPSVAQSNTPQATQANATDPLVTFVDNGFSPAGGLPGQKSEGFRGKLFVGDESLAMMGGAHFVTFHFDPGSIEFTAQTWMASGPIGGAHLKLNLVAGKHYFVEVRTRVSWPVTKQFGIKEITCDEARKEHEQDKPLEAKHLDNAGQSTLVAETSFPVCSASSLNNYENR
jgi:hypothetical protein